MSFSYSAYKGYKFYNSIFRLSYEQISSFLIEKQSQCQKFKDCVLMPGDIIIRRYKTSVTNQVDSLFNPYFLHSAMYIGNDEMFEVLGSNESPENQIVINKLSRSDWMNEDMVNFVIFRPKNYNGKLGEITSYLKNVAYDPDFLYGILDEKRKRASCADIILKQLEKNGLIYKNKNEPQIITPDYLFWIIGTNDKNIDVVGYNINPR